MGRLFWGLFAASALCLLANATITAILPLYIRDELGGDAAVVGLVVGGAALAATALRAPVGALGDRYGYRWAMAGGALLSAGGAALLLLATTPVVAGAARLAAALGGGTLQTVASVWVVEAAAPGGRGRALSLLGLSVWIGLGLGPPLGEALRGWLGFGAVWVTVAAMGLVTLGLVLRMPRPATRPPSTGTEPARWRDAARAVLRPGVAGGLAWGAQGIVLAFLILHLRAEGVAAPATVLTIFAVAVILARLVLAGVPDRYGPARAAAVSQVVAAGGLVVLAIASSMQAAAAGAILLGIGFATLQPSLTLLALERLDPRRRQAGTGLFVACMDLGVAAGTALGGLVADWRGEGTALLLAAAFTLTGAGVIAEGFAFGRVASRGDAAQAP
jgi:MFS family permease